MAILDAQPATAVRIVKAENGLKGQYLMIFRGYVHFQQIMPPTQIEEREIPDSMVWVAAHFDAPRPSYGHFRHPARLWMWFVEGGWVFLVPFGWALLNP